MGDEDVFEVPEWPEQVADLLRSAASVEQAIGIETDLVRPRLLIPDEALVVRGGIAEAAYVADNLLDGYERSRAWSVSVAVGVNTTVRHLVKLRRLQNGHVRTATVGDLREAGFTVLLTGPAAHADVVFPIDNMNEAGPWIEQFRQLLSDPQRNPWRR